MTTLTLHEEIVLAYATYIKESETFETKQVKVAASRARTALMDLCKLTKSRRKEIIDTKNSL